MKGEMDEFIPNENYASIKTLCKPISTDFAPNIKTEIMVFLHKVWPWNKLKGLGVLSVLRLKSKVDLIIGKFLEVFYFHSALVIVAKSFGKGFLRSFISFHFKYVFLVIEN